MDEIVLLFIMACSWALVVAIKRESRWRHAPEFWQKNGAIVPRLESLQGYEDLIGHYMGVAIYRRIAFQRNVYEFDRVALPDDQEGIPGGALLLSARLIYRIRPQAQALSL